MFVSGLSCDFVAHVRVLCCAVCCWLVVTVIRKWGWPAIPAVSGIRNEARLIINTIYNPFTQVCTGLVDSFQPNEHFDTVLFYAALVLIGLVYATSAFYDCYVFIHKSTMLWTVGLMVMTSGCLWIFIAQSVGPFAIATVIPGSTFTRTYTDTGEFMYYIMLIMTAVCVVLVVIRPVSHPYKENEIDCGLDPDFTVKSSSSMPEIYQLGERAQERELQQLGDGINTGRPVRPREVQAATGAQLDSLSDPPPKRTVVIWEERVEYTPNVLQKLYQFLSSPGVLLAVGIIVFCIFILPMASSPVEKAYLTKIVARTGPVYTDPTLVDNMGFAFGKLIDLLGAKTFYVYIATTVIPELLNYLDGNLAGLMDGLKDKIDGLFDSLIAELHYCVDLQGIVEDILGVSIPDIDELKNIPGVSTVTNAATSLIPKINNPSSWFRRRLLSLEEETKCPSNLTTIGFSSTRRKLLQTGIDPIDSAINVFTKLKTARICLTDVIPIGLLGDVIHLAIDVLTPLLQSAISFLSDLVKQLLPIFMDILGQAMDAITNIVMGFLPSEFRDIVDLALKTIPALKKYQSFSLLDLAGPNLSITFDPKIPTWILWIPVYFLAGFAGFICLIALVPELSGLKSSSISSLVTVTVGGLKSLVDMNDRYLTNNKYAPVADFTQSWWIYVALAVVIVIDCALLYSFEARSQVKWRRIKDPTLPPSQPQSKPLSISQKH